MRNFIIWLCMLLQPCLGFADDTNDMPDLQSLVGKAIKVTLKPQNVYIESGAPFPPGMVTFRGLRIIYTGILVKVDNHALAISPLPTAPKTFLSAAYGSLPYVSQIGLACDDRIESVEGLPNNVEDRHR
jgi:hypothetical protein